MEKFITHSFQETQKIGQDFAKKILDVKPQGFAVVLALQGDLGAGKTTFLQGFAEGLGIQEVVNSPTFVIMKKFEIPAATPAGVAASSSLRAERGNPEFKHFYHFDLYRLENETDLEFLSIKEILADPKNIVAIEWPEKISSLLPSSAQLIKFEHQSEHDRIITCQKKNY